MGQRRTPQNPEYRKIAMAMAKDCIVVGALARFIEQIVEETYAMATEAERERAASQTSHAGAFALGDRVRKVKGASWQGVVVGFYCTSMTPIGYAVESEREAGSVQIYPESALERVET